MSHIIPPSSIQLAQAAWENIQAKKGRDPQLHELWLMAHTLWWGWWADALMADQGAEYLDDLTADGWAGEHDRLLADYPQAAFPWAAMEELKQTFPGREPQPGPIQLRLFELTATGHE